MRREFPGASVVVWDCGLFAEEPEVDDHEGAMRDLASYGQLRLGGESIVATLAAIEARGISR